MLRDDWPGRFAPIPWVYAEIVRKLSQVEKVRILVEDQVLADMAVKQPEVFATLAGQAKDAVSNNQQAAA